MFFLASTSEHRRAGNSAGRTSHHAGSGRLSAEARACHEVIERKVAIATLAAAADVDAHLRACLRARSRQTVRGFGCVAAHGPR